MVAIAAGDVVKSEETAKAKTKNSGWPDFAMAMHLAAGRFSSPAGVVFMQQCYMPELLKKRD